VPSAQALGAATAAKPSCPSPDSVLAQLQAAMAAGAGPDQLKALIDAAYTAQGAAPSAANSSVAGASVPSQATTTTASPGTSQQVQEHQQQVEQQTQTSATGAGTSVSSLPSMAPTTNPSSPISSQAPVSAAGAPQPKQQSAAERAKAAMQAAKMQQQGGPGVSTGGSTRGRAAKAGNSTGVSRPDAGSAAAQVRLIHRSHQPKSCTAHDIMTCTL
jgi:hypothetical protein